MVIRVMIVDDVDALRTLYVIALDQADIEVVGEAADGAEAVELARAVKPDVVLLDIAMPTMDGLTAIPKLREASPGVRIVCLSGFGSDSLADEALSRCASAYVEKGAHIETIISKVHKVVSDPPKVGCPAA